MKRIILTVMVVAILVAGALPALDLAGSGILGTAGALVSPAQAQQYTPPPDRHRNCGKFKKPGHRHKCQNRNNSF